MRACALAAMTSPEPSRQECEKHSGEMETDNLRFPSVTKVVLMDFCLRARGGKRKREETLVLWRRKKKRRDGGGHGF